MIDQIYCRNRRVSHSVPRCKFHDHCAEKAVFRDQTSSCAGRVGHHQHVHQSYPKGVIGNNTIHCTYWSGNVAPETPLLLCSCSCTPWPAKPRSFVHSPINTFPPINENGNTPPVRTSAVIVFPMLKENDSALTSFSKTSRRRWSSSLGRIDETFQGISR